MDRLIQRTEKIQFVETEITQEEEELVNCIQETLKCTRAIMNTLVSFFNSFIGHSH